MSYTPPPKILITSDDSIIEYQRTLPKKKKNKEDEGEETAVYVYKFTKSITKQNMEFEIEHDFLKKQLTNFFKVMVES